MVRAGAQSIRMDHLPGIGNPPKSTFNKATPPMAMLATTLDDGPWDTTG